MDITATTEQHNIIRRRIPWCSDHGYRGLRSPWGLPWQAMNCHGKPHELVSAVALAMAANGRTMARAMDTPTVCHGKLWQPMVSPDLIPPGLDPTHNAQKHPTMTSDPTNNVQKIVTPPQELPEAQLTHDPTRTLRCVSLYDVGLAVACRRACHSMP